MAIHSNLKDYKLGESKDDIRGAKVYGASNEKLGEIVDVIFDLRTGEVRYVVVDSGGWLAAARFVIPTRQLMTREEDENYRVNLSKEQAKKLPEYREQDIESDERWSDFENRYEAAWVEDPVLHRAGSTHTVTPDPSEDPVVASGGKVFKNATPRRIAHDLPRFGARSNTEDPIAEGNLAGETDLQPVIPEVHEYVGVDAVIPLQASEELVKEETPKSPADIDRGDSGRAPAGSGHDGGRRFREFQERLRRDRDEILRRRNKAA